MTNAPTPRLRLVTDNNKPVNVAIIEKRGEMIVLIIDNGSMSRSSYAFHAAAPDIGRCFERRADELWEQFEGRSFQCARAAGAKTLIRGGWPSITHEQELALLDRAVGLREGQRVTVPLGD